MMNPLHAIGDALRDFFLAIPLGYARALFVAIPLLLMGWVLSLPTREVTPNGPVYRWDEDLRLWAWLALSLQVILYCVL